MSAENPELEKVWKRMSIYDFNFRILELRKTKVKESASEDAYGAK